MKKDANGHIISGVLLKNRTLVAVRELLAIHWGAFMGQRCKQITVMVKGHSRKRRRFVVRFEELAGVAVGDSVRLPNPDHEIEYVVVKIEDTEILARFPLPRRTK